MDRKQVFVSYSSKDRTVVSGLSELLKIGGTPVFRDEDSIQPGKRWQAVLTESIQNSDSVLVFWSKNAAQSAAVRQEFSDAIRLGKDVIPVLLDQTPLVEELRHYQWIDCRSFVTLSSTSTAIETAPPKSTTLGAVGATTGAIVGMMFGPLGMAVGAAIGHKLEKMADVDRSKLLESFGKRLTNGDS